MVLEVCLVVRGEDGSLIDPGELGVQGLVGLIRAVPPGAPPGEYAVFGASVDVLEAVEGVLGQVTALRAAAVHAVAEDTPGGVSSDQVPEVLMMALGRSRRSAVYLREQGLILTHQPQVWAGLWAGVLDVAKAGILARALYLVPAQDPEGAPRPGYQEDCDRVLGAGLAYAGGHTAAQLERHLRRLLAAIDPGTVVTRRRRALTERGVWLDHRGDGTADLTARLDSTDAERVYTAIRAVALTAQHTDGAASDAGGGAPGADANETGADETGAARRPFDLQMADALVDLILTPGTGTGLGSATGGAVVRTQINVTIPIDSLAGITDTPGQLSGYGILPAEVVRRLAGADTRWRHILTHRTTGAILDVGTWSYRPPAGLDRHVRTRDVTCRFPGCTVPAGECDLDHLTPFPQGPTSAQNLHALCRRHHRLKHDEGWTVTALPNSGLRWTSPQGSTRDTWPDTDHAHEDLTTATHAA